VSYSEKDNRVILTMKIFSMNDCDWMAAETLEEAKAAYIATVWAGTREPEHDAFDDPGEILPEHYDKLMFTDFDENTKCTFREQLNKMIARGDKFPAFFASTEV
jgi:hypothetical protein